MEETSTCRVEGLGSTYSRGVQVLGFRSSRSGYVHRSGGAELFGDSRCRLRGLWESLRIFHVDSGTLPLSRIDLRRFVHADRHLIFSAPWQATGSRMPSSNRGQRKSLEDALT